MLFDSSKGEWVVFKNHHDAIIREDIFYQVQNILYNRNVILYYCIYN